MAASAASARRAPSRRVAGSFGAAGLPGTIVAAASVPVRQRTCRRAAGTALAPGRRSRRGRPSTSGSSVAEGSGQRGRELGRWPSGPGGAPGRRLGRARAAGPVGVVAGPPVLVRGGDGADARRPDPLDRCGALPLHEQVGEVVTRRALEHVLGAARPAGPPVRPVSTLTSSSSPVVITSLRRLDLVARHGSRRLPADDVEPDRSDDGVVGDLEPARSVRVPGAGVDRHRWRGRMPRPHPSGGEVACARGHPERSAGVPRSDRSRPPRHVSAVEPVEHRVEEVVAVVVRLHAVADRWTKQSASGPAACSMCRRRPRRAARRPRPPDPRGAARAPGIVARVSRIVDVPELVPDAVRLPDDIEEQVPAPPARGGGGTPTASPRPRRAPRRQPAHLVEVRSAPGAVDVVAGRELLVSSWVLTRPERVVAAGCRHDLVSEPRRERPEAMVPVVAAPLLEHHAVEGAREVGVGQVQGGHAVPVGGEGLPERCALRLPRARQPEVVGVLGDAGPSCSSGACRPPSPS